MDYFKWIKKLWKKFKWIIFVLYTTFIISVGLKTGKKNLGRIIRYIFYGYETTNKGGGNHWKKNP